MLSKIKFRLIDLFSLISSFFKLWVTFLSYTQAGIFTTKLTYEELNFKFTTFLSYEARNPCLRIGDVGGSLFICHVVKHLLFLLVWSIYFSNLCQGLLSLFEFYGCYIENLNCNLFQLLDTKEFRLPFWSFRFRPADLVSS